LGRAPGNSRKKGGGEKKRKQGESGNEGKKRSNLGRSVVEARDEGKGWGKKSLLVRKPPYEGGGKEKYSIRLRLLGRKGLRMKKLP